MSLAQKIRNNMVVPSVDTVIDTFVTAINDYTSKNNTTDYYEWLHEFEFSNKKEIAFAQHITNILPKLGGSETDPAPPYVEVDHYKGFIFRNCNSIEVIGNIITRLEGMGFKDVEVGGTCGGVFFEPTEPWITRKDLNHDGVCYCTECPKSVPEFAVMGIRVRW
jgi:hypothetical protein